MFAQNENSTGINEARYAMVIYDLYSGWLSFSAQAKKTAAKAKQALKRFDPASRIKSFYCDNAPELIQAARDLGYSNPTSTPYRSTSNAVAERQNRVVLEGTRTVLSQSGCPTYWWPYAGHHFCFSRIITPHPITGVSPFKKRYPERKDFDGLRLPFGCAVDFRPPDHVLKEMGKFDEQPLPGLFLGYKVPPGGIWNKENCVAWFKNIFRGGHTTRHV